LERLDYQVTRQSGSHMRLTCSDSALEHWIYYPRWRCLIHEEQAFAANIHTLRGQAGDMGG
jgi:hypothetical protein